MAELPRTLTTADLPVAFQPDPVEIAVRAAARSRGIRLTSCVHGRTDCGDCLLALADAAEGARGASAA